MLTMTEALGFRHDEHQPVDDTVAVTLALAPPKPGEA